MIIGFIARILAFVACIPTLYARALQADLAGHWKGSVAHELNGANVKLEITSGKARVSVPGQPTSTLAPKTYDEFELVEYPIVRVRSTRDDKGAITTLSFDQPNGLFEAKRK